MRRLGDTDEAILAELKKLNANLGGGRGGGGATSISQSTTTVGGATYEGDTIGGSTVEGDTIHGGDTTVHGGDTIINEDGQRTPQGRYTTGPSGRTIDKNHADQQYEEFSFGFTAGFVSIRSSQPLVFAFNDPHNNPGRLSLVEDPPLSVGGSYPVLADRVWVGLADPAVEEGVIHVYAF